MSNTERTCTLRAAAVGIALMLALMFSYGVGLSQAVQSAGRRIDWTDRLERLRPQEPDRYLELAEEVEDAAANEDDKRLARHLYALAGALEPERLGRSACLALAAMEENPLARKRLRALAALLPGTGGAVGVTGDAGGGPREWSISAAVAAGEAMSHYRRGDGTRALAALNTAGADSLLQHYGNMLPGGYRRFVEDCKAYRGQTAPTLSSTDVLRMLRFEAALLAGRDREWSGELLLSGGQPLIEVDPMRLEEALNVDVTRPLYRGGRWTDRDIPRGDRTNGPER